MVRTQQHLVVHEAEVSYHLSLQEITISLGVSPEVIIAIMDEGIVTAPTKKANKLEFDSTAIKRIKTAIQLHNDLHVNWAGAALALDLLAEIDRLKHLLAR